LSEDLQALLRIGPQRRAGEPLDVGESGTLFRFLQFAAWKRGEDRQFIKRGTLKHRPLTVSPDITTWPLDRLLELDNGTSQWASAAVLMGNQERQPAAVPYKLGLTYEALEHWQKVKSAKTPLEFRLDETIKRQAEAY